MGSRQFLSIKELMFFFVSFSVRLFRHLAQKENKIKENKRSSNIINKRRLRNIPKSLVYFLSCGKKEPFSKILKNLRACLKRFLKTQGNNTFLVFCENSSCSLNLMFFLCYLCFSKRKNNNQICLPSIFLFF